MLKKSTFRLIYMQYKIIGLYQFYLTHQKYLRNNIIIYYYLFIEGNNLLSKMDLWEIDLKQELFLRKSMTNARGSESDQGFWQRNCLDSVLSSDRKQTVHYIHWMIRAHIYIQSGGKYKGRTIWSNTWSVAIFTQYQWTTKYCSTQCSVQMTGL